VTRRLLPPLLAALALAVGCAGNGPPTGPGPAGTVPSDRPTRGPGKASPGATATPDPAGTSLVAPPTGTPGPDGTATPRPPLSLADRIAIKLSAIARLSFTGARAGLLSDQGGELVSDQGGGVVSNNGGAVVSTGGGLVLANNGAAIVSDGGLGIISDGGLGIISDQGGGLIGQVRVPYRLAQGAPTIMVGPRADETLVVRRTWDAGGMLYRYKKTDGELGDYGRWVHVSPAGNPVYETTTTVVERHANGKAKRSRFTALRLSEAGELRTSRTSFSEYDDAGALLRTAVDPGVTKTRFPESGVAIDVDAFEIDVKAKTGKFVYRYVATGLVDTGTLEDVTPNGSGGFTYTNDDPLSRYGGRSEVRDAAGALVFTKTRKVAGGAATLGYDLGDGVVVALSGSAAGKVFSGTIAEHGVVVADTVVRLYEDGTTIFSVMFKDRPGTTVRVGFGVDPGPAPTPMPTATPAPAWRTETIAGAEAGLVDGPAKQARFGKLGQLAASRLVEGKFYLADVENDRIRVLTRTGEPYAEVWTVGSLPAVIDAPWGLAVGPDDTLYVSQSDVHRVSRVKADGTTVEAIAGDGTPGYAEGAGGAARFDIPRGLVLRGDTLYLADGENDRVRSIDLADPTFPVSNVAGDGTTGYADGPGATARFDTTFGLCLGDDGALYVSEVKGRMIRRIDLGAPGLPVTTFAGIAADTARSFQDGPRGEAGIYAPLFVIPDGKGGLYAGRIDVRGIAPDGTLRSITGQNAAGTKDGPHDAATFTLITGAVRLPGGALLLADETRVRWVHPPGGR
jgi:sugar lactone lactonase YvrE